MHKKQSVTDRPTDRPTRWLIGRVSATKKENILLFSSSGWSTSLGRNCSGRKLLKCHGSFRRKSCLVFFFRRGLSSPIPLSRDRLFGVDVGDEGRPFVSRWLVWSLDGARRILLGFLFCLDQRTCTPSLEVLHWRNCSCYPEEKESGGSSKSWRQQLNNYELSHNGMKDNQSYVREHWSI